MIYLPSNLEYPSLQIGIYAGIVKIKLVIQGFYNV